MGILTADAVNRDEGEAEQHDRKKNAATERDGLGFNCADNENKGEEGEQRGQHAETCLNGLVREKFDQTIENAKGIFSKSLYLGKRTNFCFGNILTIHKMYSFFLQTILRRPRESFRIGKSVAKMLSIFGKRKRMYSYIGTLWLDYSTLFSSCQ